MNFLCKIHGSIATFINNKHYFVFERVKEKKKNENDSLIVLPLSPGYPKGSTNCHDTYFRFLDKAFCDESIKNIAITGNFGIGKSSFLKEWSKKKRGKKPLFISLCHFGNNPSSSNNLEFDLLQQLFWGCGYEVRNGQIRPKKRIGIRIVCALFETLFCLSFLFASFFNQIIAFLSQNIESIASFLQIPFLTDETKTEYFQEKLASIEVKMNSCRYCAIIYIILCLIVILFLAFAFLPIKKTSLKIGNVQVDMESSDKANTTIIDQNRLVLVQTLKKNKNRFGSTIIFEDLDRIDREKCLLILSELREINRLVNENPTPKCAKRIIRFIYVIHDGIFTDCHFDDVNDFPAHLKFFDYILPVVPSMIGKSSANYVQEVFENIGFSAPDFITEMSDYLSDYRLIKNIANEYATLKAVHLEKLGKSGKYNVADEDALVTNGDLTFDGKKYLMALTIYKVMCPGEYACIRNDTSDLIGKAPSEVFQHKNVQPMFSNAIDRLIEKGWLSNNCLLFVGYNITEIQAYIQKLFSSKDTDESNAEAIRVCINEFYKLCVKLINEQVNAGNAQLYLGDVGYTFLKKAIEQDDVCHLPCLNSIVVPITISENIRDINETLEDFFSHLTNSDEDKTKLDNIMQYLKVYNDDQKYDWFWNRSTECNFENRVNDELRMSYIIMLETENLKSFIESSDRNRMLNWIEKFSKEYKLPAITYPEQTATVLYQFLEKHASSCQAKAFFKSRSSTKY